LVVEEKGRIERVARGCWVRDEDQARVLPVYDDFGGGGGRVVDGDGITEACAAAGSCVGMMPSDGSANLN
jgi:hypothetical protein